MLDNPEKTARLLAALKAAVPFEVDLTPAVVKQLFISLTHVRMPRTMPLAAAVADYQKHRVKKLKKQGPV